MGRALALLLATALWAAALAPPAARAGMRCEGALIEEGDSMARVLLECGEPLLRQTIALDNTSTTEGVVEQWTYDLGPGRFLQIVTFEGGQVLSIESGRRR